MKVIGNFHYRFACLMESFFQFFVRRMKTTYTIDSWEKKEAFNFGERFFWKNLALF